MDVYIDSLSILFGHDLHNGEPPWVEDIFYEAYLKKMIHIFTDNHGLSVLC